MSSTPFFHKKVYLLVNQLIRDIVMFEEKYAIFIQKMRLRIDGTKIHLRTQRMKNSFAEDDVSYAESRLKWHVVNFWVRWRVDRFVLDIDVTGGNLKVEWWDWGVVRTLDDEEAKGWIAKQRIPSEHLMEGFLYDEPESWFSKISSSSVTVGQILGFQRQDTGDRILESGDAAAEPNTPRDDPNH